MKLKGVILRMNVVINKNPPTLAKQAQDKFILILTNSVVIKECLVSSVASST